MRGEHDASAFLNSEANCRQRFADASVVRDDAVFERNVEVHADEDALAAKVEIVDGELVHSLRERRVNSAEKTESSPRTKQPTNSPMKLEASILMYTRKQQVQTHSFTIQARSYTTIT